MALPTLAFLKASLKLWQSREAHHAKLVTRDKAKVALRKRQLAEREQLDANRPTVMYDSVTVSAIPANAPAVAGYTSGHFPTFPELVKEFPKARKLSIAVSSTHDAECLDVEPGDATPAVAAGWVKRQQARGVKRPVIYGSRDAIPRILNALHSAGIDRGQIRIWSAHFTGHSHLCGPACGAAFDADATQWTDRALGRNLDESKVTKRFWG